MGNRFLRVLVILSFVVVSSAFAQSRKAAGAATKGAPTDLTPAGGMVTLVSVSPTTISAGCDVVLRASTDFQPAGAKYSWRLYGNGNSLAIEKTTKPSVDFIVGQKLIGSGSYSVQLDVTFCCGGQDGKQQMLVSQSSDSVQLTFTGKVPFIHNMHMLPPLVKGGSAADAKSLAVVINLDTPAPSPCGQRVYLRTSNKNLAWLTAGTSFVIPPGQTQGSLSWFLGTKNVGENRTVDVIATVNGVDGYAGLVLIK